MRKLKKEGIIRKYTIDIDWKKQGMNNKALIFVKVDKNTEQKKGKVGEIEEKISKYPLVLNVKRLRTSYHTCARLLTQKVFWTRSVLLTYHHVV